MSCSVAPVGITGILKDILKLVQVNLFAGGRKAEFYGITVLYLRDNNPFMEDLHRLFKVLEEGRIKPLIETKLSILDVRKANELLESGQVTGNIVLLVPELL